MIKDILKRKNVKILNSAADWMEAIQICCAPLIEDGCITEAYPNAIIHNTETYGPYYVLCTNVALLHARPQDGVITQQMSITLLKEPIYFKNKDVPARLLITLAAINTQSHLDALKQVAELLDSSKKIEELVSIQDEDTLFESFIQE